MFGKEKSQYIEDSKFRYTMREMKKNGSAYILALPYFLLFLIFTGIPVVISLPVGFTNFNMVQFPQWDRTQQLLYSVPSGRRFPYCYPEYACIRYHHRPGQLHRVLPAGLAHQ